MKKFLALCLALTLIFSLSGCNKEPAATDQPTPPPTEQPTGGPVQSATPEEDVLGKVEFLPDNAQDPTVDILGFSGDTTLLTVNGEEITAQEYLYWLGNMTAYYNNLYAAYTGQGITLTDEIEKGTTWDERLKEIAYQNVLLLTLTPKIAQDRGVALSRDQLLELVDQRQANVDRSGREVYAYQLQAMNINDRQAFEMDHMSALFNAIQETYVSQILADLDKDRVDGYIKEQDILGAKHILLLTKDMVTGQPYDDAKIAEQKAKAEDILAQLKGGADFDTLMKENSEDTGLESYPEGYTFTAGEMVPEFENAARMLDIGKFSDIVESDYGFHIILRTDPDSEELRQEMAETEFNDLVQTYIDAADVVKSEEYDSFTTEQYYEPLLEFQQGLEKPVETENKQNEELQPQG